MNSERVVELAVNRPGAQGWKRGMIVPHELQKLPLWAELSIEDAMLEGAEVAPAPHDEAAARKERELERAARDWGAMWMRLSS